MEDIAPSLLEKILNDFSENLKNNGKAQSILETIQSGKGNYEIAGNYAEEVGAALSDAFKDNLSSDVLPDGKMYYNIADRVIREPLTQDYNIVSEVSQEVQQSLNEAAGLQIKAKAASLNEDRISGIIEKVVNADHFDDVAAVLDAPVRTFSRSVADDTLQENINFQGKAGLSPKIVRKSEYRCCAWCSALAGTYTYPDTPKDIYRRHQNCRCTVEYSPGGKSRRRQDVWSKEWKTEEESAKIEERKSIGRDIAHKFQSEALLKQHFQKHEDEFGTISIPEYQRMASALAEKEDSEDVASLLRPDGSRSKYCFSTNEFVVVNEDGTIRTYFKPENKEAYWQYELERN